MVPSPDSVTLSDLFSHFLYAFLTFHFKTGRSDGVAVRPGVWRLHMLHARWNIPKCESGSEGMVPWFHSFFYRLEGMYFSGSGCCDHTDFYDCKMF